MNGYLQYLYRNYREPGKIIIIRSNNAFSDQIVFDEFQWTFPNAKIEFIDFISNFIAGPNDMIVYPYAGWNGKILMHEKYKMKPLFFSKQNKESYTVFFETTSRIVQTIKCSKLKFFLVKWYFYTVLIVIIQKFSFLKKLAFFSYRLFHN